MQTIAQAVRGSQVSGGLRWFAQGLALVSSVLYDAAEQHQTEPSAPLPSLSFFCFPFPFSAFPCPCLPFLSLLFFLSFSSLFPLFLSLSLYSFLFSLSSLNFCPQSLSPISFCLIFAKNRRNKDCLWTKRR